MVEKSKEATIEEAYGKKLDAPLKYSFKWQEFATFDELKAAGRVLTEKQQLKVRNTQAQNVARQDAWTAALAGIGIMKPTAENDGQVRLKETFKNLMTAKLPDGTPKYTREQAREVASQVIGETWADEDDEE